MKKSNLKEISGPEMGSEPILVTITLITQLFKKLERVCIV